MAKEMQLSKDGVNVYPLTKDGQVFMSNGKTLKQTMEIDHRTVLHVDYQDSFDLSLLEVSRRHGLILVGGGYGDDIEARILPSFNEGSNWLFEYGDGWKITGDISGWEAGLDSWEGFVNYINLHSSPLTNKSTVDAVSGRISSILKTINNEEYVNPAKVDINICTDMFDFDKLDDTISRIADQLENDAREINSLKHKDNELSLKVNELDEAVNGGSTSVTDITNSFVFTNNKILYASGSNFGKAATNSAGTFKAFGYADAVSLADYVGQKIRITLPYYKKSDGSQTTAGIVFYSAKSVESAVKGYQMPLGDIAPNTIEITIEENYKYLAACYLMDTSVVGAFKCEVVQSVSGGGLVDKVADLEDTTESIEEKMPLKFTPCNKALGAICFTWDDGSVEDDLVYEKFKAKGAKCGFSLIANATFISESGRNKTYKKYQSEGFSCFSHSSNTKTSEEVDEATFKANVLTARKNLESVGITANGFVYPGNKWAYSDYLGSMHGYLFGEGSTTPNTHETPLNRVKRCEIESKTEERIKEIIDDVCTNGGLVAFYGHAARIGTTGYNNMAFYETIIDYIKAKVDAGQCYFDSPDRVIKYYFGL